MRKLSLYWGLLAIVQWAPAYAYIGPGAGAGTIAIVLGILSSIFLAFVGIIWYPIKRLIKGIKGTRKNSVDVNADSKESGPSSGSGT